MGSLLSSIAQFAPLGRRSPYRGCGATPHNQGADSKQPADIGSGGGRELNEAELDGVAGGLVKAAAPTFKVQTVVTKQ